MEVTQGVVAQLPGIVVPLLAQEVARQAALGGVGRPDPGMAAPLGLVLVCLEPSIGVKTTRR